MPWFEDNQIPFTFEYPDNFWVKKISGKSLPALTLVREDVEYWPKYLHLTWEATTVRVTPPGWQVLHSDRLQTPGGETEYVVARQISYRFFLVLSILLIGLAFITNLRSVLLIGPAILFLAIASIIYFTARRTFTVAFNYAGVEYVFTFYDSSLKKVLYFMDKVSINS